MDLPCPCENNKAKTKHNVHELTDSLRKLLHRHQREPNQSQRSAEYLKIKYAYSLFLNRLEKTVLISTS